MSFVEINSNCPFAKQTKRVWIIRYVLSKPLLVGVTSDSNPICSRLVGESRRGFSDSLDLVVVLTIHHYINLLDFHYLSKTWVHVLLLFVLQQTRCGI